MWHSPPRLWEMVLSRLHRRAVRQAQARGRLCHTRLHRRVSLKTEAPSRNPGAKGAPPSAYRVRFAQFSRLSRHVAPPHRDEWRSQSVSSLVRAHRGGQGSPAFVAQSRPFRSWPASRGSCAPTSRAIVGPENATRRDRSSEAPSPHPLGLGAKRAQLVSPHRSKQFSHCVSHVHDA